MGLGLICFTLTISTLGSPCPGSPSPQAWPNPTSLLVDLGPGPFWRRTLLPLSPFSTPTIQIPRELAKLHARPDHDSPWGGGGFCTEETEKT